MGAYFYPAVDARGKYHRAALVTNTAVCGVGVILDVSPLASIEAGDRPHPIICRRCLFAA